MRLFVAAVGRLKDAAERDMSERYLKRFNTTGRSIGLGPAEVVELVEGRGATADVRRADEAQRLIKISGVAEVHYALEVAGEAITSEGLAMLLRRERDGGAKGVAFMIGGPDGHGGEVLAGARKCLSLGAVTLPHGLARVVLLEQIYRAATILSGHPYHRA
jgi:23S rRNA (pseudouridine1915-N3)-methyltransferase